MVATCEDSSLREIPWEIIKQPHVLAIACLEGAIRVAGHARDRDDAVQLSQLL
jgi:hypothetical protein